MDPNVEIFLKYEYAEATNLAKSFLTLIAAILVFSVTFSERVVGFQTAGRSSRVLLVTHMEPNIYLYYSMWRSYRFFL